MPSLAVLHCHRRSAVVQGLSSIQSVNQTAECLNAPWHVLPLSHLVLSVLFHIPAGGPLLIKALAYLVLFQSVFNL